MTVRRKFVYAEIKGIWAYNPETFIQMDGSETKHVEPGQFGMHIMGEPRTSASASMSFGS